MYAAEMMKISLPQFNMVIGLDMLTMKLKITFSVVTALTDTAFGIKRETASIFLPITLLEWNWISLYVKIEELEFYAVSVEMVTLYSIIAVH